MANKQPPVDQLKVLAWVANYILITERNAKT